MVWMDANRQLLLGLLALQNGFVSQHQLVAAFGVWTLDKTRPLDQLLLEQKAIDAKTCDLLGALVERHLMLHGDDSERSLAAIPAQDDVRQRLTSIADPDLQASLVRLPGGVGTRRDDVAVTQAMPTTPAGGRFVILRPHARGGLGKVSVALDSELNRNVALKEIRDEYADDAFSQSRFVQEAEITGQLEHPGIVPVYGLGSYRDGRPYYAMRFVEGDSLKSAIENFHKSRQERGPLSGKQTVEFRNLLARFVGACHAIQYAHSRKVIHRDLKPENILLGPYGETLVVDWGLAKSLDREQPARGATETISAEADTMMRPVKLKEGSGGTPTIEGAALGTPAYMSPEQSAGRVSELGPPADVYSLGATLYYLLTGQPAFRGDEVSELLALVQRGEIPAPRTIWHAAPRSLESICLKAMSLKPVNRYPSARALAEDIERYFADEPVTACIDPVTVRMRRWMKRHPALVAGAAATVILGLTSAITLAVLSQQHNSVLTKKNTTITSQFSELQARNQTIEEQNAALEVSNKTISDQKTALEKRNVELELARKQEQQAKVRAENVKEYLVQMFRSASPGAGHKDIRVVDILDRQAMSLMLSFNGDPLDRASLLHAIGESYDGLGEYAKAEPLHRMALRLRKENLPSDAYDTLFSMNVLGRCIQNNGKLTEAAATFEEANAKCTKTLGVRHDLTLTAQANLGDAYRELGRFEESAKLFNKVVEIRKVETPHDEGLAYAMNGLALSYGPLGRSEEAIPLFQEALKKLIAIFGPTHPESLICHGNLADAYRNDGQLQKAKEELKVVIADRTKVLGERHAQTLYARSNLASVLESEGEIKEAQAILLDVHQKLEEQFGKEYPETLYCKINLGRVCLKLMNVAKGVQLLDEAFEIAKGDPNRLARVIDHAADEYGGVFESVENYSKAVSIFQSAADALAKASNAPPQILLGVRARLADSLRGVGRVEESIAIYRDIYKQRRELLGSDAPQTLFAANNLALCLHFNRQYAEALKFYEEAVKGLTRRFGAEHSETLIARSNLAELLIDLDQLEKALAQAQEQLAIHEKNSGPKSRSTANCLEIAAQALLLLGRFDEAQPMAERAVAIRTELDTGHWPLPHAQALLGWSLFRQGKLDEAEKLLLDGVNGCITADHLPRRFWPRLQKMTEQLVALFEAKNKPEEAAKWKAKLEALHAVLSPAAEKKN